MEPRLHVAYRILVSQQLVDTELLPGLVAVGHRFVLVLVIVVHLVILEHLDDGFVVALAAEFEEGARFPVFGVGFEVAFFAEQWQDVEVFLQAAFVVQIAQDLLGAVGCGGDVFAALRALGDLVGFEEAVPRRSHVRYAAIMKTRPYQWK
jgi:hypothetical protein